MTITPNGPGEPFTTLFDAQPALGPVLPEALAHLYGPWPLPAPTERPYTFSNFVMSHDGRVSFNAPGQLGGGPISRRDGHDRWLMGLIRSRADAILVGGSSIASAGKHVWTPEAVYPEDADAWVALRAHEGRRPLPLLVVLTRSGEVPAHAPALDNPALPVLVATTPEGERRARETLGPRAHVSYLVQGDQLDQPAVVRALRSEYGIATLLVEAGPQVYAALIADGLIDDAFLTISPIMVGEDREHTRPSLTEGVAFGWEQPPQLQLLSVHRHGSYLYLHSRYERQG